MKTVKNLFVAISLFYTGQTMAGIASGIYTYTSNPGHPSCGMQVQLSSDKKHLITKNVTNPETGMACDMPEYESHYSLVGPDTYTSADHILTYNGAGQFSIDGAGNLDLAYYSSGPAPKPTVFRGSGLPPSATQGSVDYHCKIAYRAAFYNAQEQCQSYYGSARCQSGKIEDVEYDKVSTEGFVSCSSYLFLKLK